MYSYSPTWIAAIGNRYPAGGGAPATVYRLVIDTFTADGTWTCPADVLDDTAKVECWGAGGGSTTDVGGGGGGAYAMTPDVAVVATTGYAVQVGVSASDTNGEDSTFNSTTVVAKGGLSGTNGGTGGTAAASTGTTKFSGADGTQGTGDQVGGGGAGSTANASSFNGGAPDGGQASSAGALPGALPGGGASSTAIAQTLGGEGQVRVIYELEATSGFPYLVDFSVGRDTTTQTTRAVTMPANYDVGDLLVIEWACDGDDDGAGDHEFDGSFTRLAAASNGTTVTSAIAYKIAAGSDTCTITTNEAEIGTYIVRAFRNAGTPTATSANGSSTNPDPPSHDAGSSQKYLWLVTAALDGSGNLVYRDGIEPPANYGDFIYQTQGAQGSGALIGSATRYLETQTEDPGVFTSATEQWVTFTVAIPPA